MRRWGMGLGVVAVTLLGLSSSVSAATPEERDAAVTFALRRAALELGAGRPAAAARVLQRLSPRPEASHRQAIAMLLWAESSILSGDVTRGARLVDSLRVVDDDFVRVQAQSHALALRLAAAGAPHAVEADRWAELVRQAPGDLRDDASVGFLLQAVHALSRGDSATARDAWRNVRGPIARPVAEMLQAEALLRRGAGTEAREVAERLADRHQTVLDGWLQDWAALTRARSLAMQGDLDEAIDVLQDIETPALESYAALLQAQLHHERGRPQEALSLLTALQLENRNASLACEAALLRAQILLDLGNLQDAASVAQSLRERLQTGVDAAAAHEARLVVFDLQAWHASRTRRSIEWLVQADVLRHVPQPMALDDTDAVIALVPAGRVDSLQAAVTLLAPFQHTWRDRRGEEAAEALARRVSGLNRRVLLEEEDLRERERRLAQRQRLLQQGLRELQDLADTLQWLRRRLETTEAALQGHVEALADQESAWIAALEGRLAAVRHALVSLRHGVERLQARHPEDRVLRRSAAVDAGRTELRAASEWIAVVDSLQDWWQHGLRQRVQSILHETEPAMLASRIEALQAELAALQARSAALLARLQDGDLRERRAVQQAVARLHGLRSDRDEAVRQWDMASQAVQQQARRRWSARRRGYIEAADDARVTAIFLSARRSSGEGALRQWRRATQSLQEYLALHPHGVRADEMWRRLAESHLQHATLQYTSDLARYLQNGGSESDAPLPVQDYADALEALDQLLQQFPQSPHVADAHFQSGFLLAEMGSPRASSEHLERFLALVDSSEALWGRAALRIADNHLQLSQRTAACSAYARAARGSDAEAADVALFKLGWCHYDQEHPEQARQALRALLERAATSDSSRAADLQPEALELLALAFADDHEVSEAASVLEQWGQPAWSFVVKRRMAQLFAARAQYDEAIRGYQSLLQDHAMDPRMAGAVEEWLRLVAVHRGEAEAHELAADLALHFTPQGEWARHAASPQQGYELEPAWQSRLVEEDRQAARSDSVSLVLADPQRAATRMAAHLRAAAVFAHRQALVDSTHRSVSLDQAVQRYRDLLQRFPGADKEAQTWLYLGEARAAQGDPLAAADAYGRAQAHPRADSTVVAQARGGELVALDAAAARRLPGALERYEATARRLTDEKPRDPQGWNALERVGELAFHAADWERSEAAYVDLAEGTRDDARAARALKIAGDTWWRRDDALRAGQRYARAYPVAVQSGSDSLVTVLDDLIPGAWMQAAANRQEHDRGDAIELYERVAQDHPAHELAPRALYSAAQLRSAEGDLEGALHDHALLLERYPEDPLRKDARLESARLAEAVHQPSRAASHLEAVLSDLSQEDDRIAARLHIAALRLEAGQPQQADEQYARVLERVHPPDGAPRDSALAADLWMRRARLATQGPQRAAHYAHALECASQLSDADAAEARFFVTDSRRPAYEDLTLTQPIDATLEAKKAALEVLVAGYGETLQRGVHPWHAAASLRLGESLAAFGDALRDSEPPSGLEGDDLWGWQEAMNLQAQSLEDRAVATWSLGLRGARDAHEDDAWTTGLRDRLYPMLSRRVPTQPVPQFVLVVPHED